MGYIISLVVMFITVGAGFFYTQRQIDIMKNIEKEKRRVAIQAIIVELESNEKTLEAYAEHYEKGGHSGKETNYSWDLVAPSFNNYNLYLIQACYSDKTLAKEITSIYSIMEACKALIEQNLQATAYHSLTIRDKDPNAEKLKEYIVSNNKLIYDFSRSILPKIAKIKGGLEGLKKSII